MDIKGGLTGAGIALGIVAALWGGAALANAEPDTTPVVVEAPVAVAKTAPPVPVVPPEPAPVVVPEVVVVPEPAVVPEPVIEPAPVPEAVVDTVPIGPDPGNGPVVLQPGEAPPADAPPGTAYMPPPSLGG